jgi:hypothetical protein
MGYGRPTQSFPNRLSIDGGGWDVGHPLFAVAPQLLKVNGGIVEAGFCCLDNNVELVVFGSTAQRRPSTCPIRGFACFSGALQSALLRHFYRLRPQFKS